MDGCLRLTAVIIAGLAMLGGMGGVFWRLHVKKQGFGSNSLRALGVVMFIPALVIVGVAFPDFKSETIAALFGTVAGYVLSQAARDEDDSSGSPQTTASSADPKSN